MVGKVTRYNSELTNPDDAFTPVAEETIRIEELTSSTLLALHLIMLFMKMLQKEHTSSISITLKFC